MIKHFLKLEWKSFIRSASFGKGLAIKILMGFLALYFIAMFLGMGLLMYPGLKEIYPEKDPLIIVNSFLFYWILAEWPYTNLPSVIIILPFVTNVFLTVIQIRTSIKHKN